MRRALLVLPALTGVLLAGCSAEAATPAPAALSAVPAERVRETMQPGNPWAQLSNDELDKRGENLCTGLDTYGLKFFTDLADMNETTAPGPDEVTPDLNRAQTLDMYKAAVGAYCPEKSARLDW